METSGMMGCKSPGGRAVALQPLGVLPTHDRFYTTFVQRCMLARASIFGLQGARKGMIIRQQLER